MDEQFCIMCGNAAKWIGMDSDDALMCDDCTSHLLTPMLDFFVVEDEMDFD